MLATSGECNQKSTGYGVRLAYIREKMNIRGPCPSRFNFENGTQLELGFQVRIELFFEKLQAPPPPIIFIMFCIMSAILIINQFLSCN